MGSSAPKNHAVGGIGDAPRQPIRGPNSKALKFGVSMCAQCNNARSQPFDRAYVLLMDWVADNEETILAERRVDLKRIYGRAWRDRAPDMARYFLKHACCQLADSLRAGSVLIGNDLLEYLDGDPRWPTSFTAEFYIDTSLLLVTDLQNSETDRVAFSPLAGSTATPMKQPDSWSGPSRGFAGAVSPLHGNSIVSTTVQIQQASVTSPSARSPHSNPSTTRRCASNFLIRNPK